MKNYLLLLSTKSQILICNFSFGCPSALRFNFSEISSFAALKNFNRARAIPKFFALLKKKINLKFYLLLFITWYLLFCFSTSLVWAQTDFYQDEEIEETEVIKYPMFMGLKGQVLFPQNEFSDKMQQPGYGGQLEFLINLNQSPFYVGFASSIANFGNEVFDFTDTDGFDLKWKTNSSLWDGHLTVHIEPPLRLPFQPYLRGQAGFTHFFTVSRLVDPEFEDDNPLERYVDDNSWGWSYGGAFGLLIPLDKKWITMLDIRGTYLRGTNSSFYAKRQDTYSIQEDSIEAFNLEESPIQLFGLQIGVLVFIE